MIALFLHDDAIADLDGLFETDPDAAGRIAALLEQLDADPDLLDRLSQHDFGASYSQDFHVSKWHGQWRNGRNLWRLKIWVLEDRDVKYRVVYAFLPSKQHYYVLAIAPRGFNYDQNHPLSKRIIAAYDELVDSC